MAKKVVISFSGQPVTTGAGWSYAVEVSGYRLPYNSGVIDCEIFFKPNGDPQTLNNVPIGTTLAETLTITLAHLRANFVNSAITYNIAGDTIEVLINSNATVNVSASLNANIEITQSEVEPDFLNLKYFIIFDDYRLDIMQKNYLGFATEIFGAISINKGSVSTILEPIRGTGLNIALEANSALTFDEFGLADEFTYKTQLKKGSQVVFNGYIKPDGIQQNWVNDEWLVNIESVDGLGLLNDLSFVQSNGVPFTGKISMYDVIKGCLDRTGLLMTINTSIGIEYNGYAGTNILKDSYINSERFIKAEKDDVIMDCNAVLTSVLNLFSGVITQENGQWWVYRPNDLVLNGLATFINQTTNATFTKNLTNVLGSQIDNFYPHHCDSNQQIEMKGAISAYRLNYEYGFLDGFVINKNLVHDSNMLFEGWTVLNPSLIINDPLDTQGVLMISNTYYDTTKYPIIKSNSYSVNNGNILSFTIKTSNLLNELLRQIYYFSLKTSTGKYAQQDGTWGTSIYYITTYDKGVFGDNSFNFIMSPILEDCDIEITLYKPKVNSLLRPGDWTTEIVFVDLVDITKQQKGIVGEFHTVSRKNPPSSITKENQTVFNGDGDFNLIGSIYKSDKINLTDLWSRTNKFESYPLLQISAEDDLRIQCNAIKVFSGGIYGLLPYLSVISINNVVGLFMFTDWSYDLVTNKVNGKLTQFYNNDLGDIEYLFSYDYGNNAIRPTIKG